jgi:hypothetical protein
MADEKPVGAIGPNDTISIEATSGHKADGRPKVEQPTGEDHFLIKCATLCTKIICMEPWADGFPRCVRTLRGTCRWPGAAWNARQVKTSFFRYIEIMKNSISSS